MKKRVIVISSLILLMAVLLTCLVACDIDKLSLDNCVDKLERKGYVIDEKVAYEGTTLLWRVEAEKIVNDDDVDVVVLMFSSAEYAAKMLEGNLDPHYLSGQIVILAETEEVLKEVVEILGGKWNQ